MSMENKDNQPHISVVEWGSSDKDITYRYRMSDGRSFSVSQKDLVDNLIKETTERTSDVKVGRISVG